ncbi:MAG: tetratricopeptide repeat protein [Pseudonocardia sp.]
MHRLRLWFGVPAVVAGVVVGLLTNIVTSNPTWPVAIGLVVAVAVLVGLTMGQAARDHGSTLGSLRLARAAVLEFLDAQPVDAGEHTISSLLAAECALAPFRARSSEEKQLLEWCLDRDSPAVWLLAGPSGVGKSRLAVEFARGLPDGWARGRCVTGKAGVVMAPVLACGQPTLIVVDDADIEPDVAALVSHARAQPERGAGKVLLIARDDVAFEHSLNQRLPEREQRHLPTTVLPIVGASGDRRRWFGEAAVAYATALGRPVLVSVTDFRPVGAEGDPMVLTQARAVLAALAESRERADAVRGAGLDAVAAELVAHERRRWDQSARDEVWGLPGYLTAPLRADAVLALALFAPATREQAVPVLRLVSGLADETDATLRNTASWAHHLYPGLGPVQVAPAPDFLRAAILACLIDPQRAELREALLRGLPARHDPSVLDRLIRAAVFFPGIAPLIGRIAREQLGVLTVAVEYLVLTGPAAQVVERYLIETISAELLPAAEIDRLLDLVDPTQFRRLELALRELAVACARQRLAEDDNLDARAHLAFSLNNYGAILRELGRHREALTVTTEAVELRRGLAASEPARHILDLAFSLNNYGAILRELGRHREALTVTTEAVELRRGLAASEPARHTPNLARSLHNYGASLLCSLARHEDELDARAEAVA